jgi:hypothetical protein
MSLRHIVTWKLGADDAAERDRVAQEIKQRLLALPAVIDDIRSIEVGINDAGPDDNFHVALTATFDDADGLARYQVHPDHQAVAAYIRSVVVGRSGIDYTV